MTTISETWIVTSGGPAPEVPDLPLPDFLLAGKAPDRPAIVDGPSGRGLTYGELADGVRRVAAGFAARGLGTGEAVALLAPNLPEWLLAAYGVMTAGGVVTGVNPLCTAGEVAGQLADADARFLVTVPPFLPIARAAVAGRRTRDRADRPADGGHHPVRGPAPAQRPAAPRAPRPGDGPGDAALLERDQRAAQGRDADPPRVRGERGAAGVRDPVPQRRPGARRRTVLPRRGLRGGGERDAARRRHAGDDAALRRRAVPRTDRALPRHGHDRGPADRPRPGQAPRRRRRGPAVAALHRLRCRPARRRRAAGRRRPRGLPGAAGLGHDGDGRGRGDLAARHPDRPRRRGHAVPRGGRAGRRPGRRHRPAAGRGRRAVDPHPVGDGGLPRGARAQPPRRSTPTAGCTPATSPRCPSTAWCTSSTGSRS